MSKTLTVDDLMEQAQVFASAWATFGGRFDFGQGAENAEAAKQELQAMIETALAQAVAGSRRFKLQGDAFDCGAELYRSLVIGTLEAVLTTVDELTPGAQRAGAREQLMAGFLAGAAGHAVMEIGGAATADLLAGLASATPAAAAAGAAAAAAGGA